MGVWSEVEQAAQFQTFIKDIAEKRDFGADDVIAIARSSNMFRVEQIATAIVNQLGSTVLSGPFEGMQLVPVQLGSMLMPKLLGTYETEIAHLFRDMSRFTRLVDIGSAEGYYAVGCPFAHPHLTSIGFDTAEEAQAVCSQSAALNGVADRVALRGFCDADELANLATPDTLIVIDIDGGETDLLCSRPAERLARAELIVEVHQSGASTTETNIVPHFAKTHQAQIFRQRPVDSRQFGFLDRLSSFERFLTVWEGRKTEAWLHLMPR